ncbi:aldehyde dehydrogenase family protein [Streptosporangium sp. NPDC000509]|uniref:aldehyde dehydrogenase family protein n=1 Tax=Streptosporangium sp. NPDC000509 TaxID=3366186 RepID=UPI0036C9970E
MLLRAWWKVNGRLRRGTVRINDHRPYAPRAERGGFRRPGIGREPGQAGPAEYRETKHVRRNVRPRPQRWFRG